MSLFLDSFWRALDDSLSARALLLSLLPLAVMLAAGVVLGYLFWDAAAGGLAQWLDGSRGVAAVSRWLGALGLGLGPVTALLAPVLLVLLAAPVLVVATLLLVSFLTTPAVLRMVARHHFAQLAQRGPRALLRAALWAGWSTLLAVLALLLTLPLWFIPPLILVLPPLIWGWLTCRVMSRDALDLHATRAERQWLLRRHRAPLLLMGIACGYLSAAPAIIWASLLLFAVAFPILIPVGIWIYSMVFVFSALWFVHYLLTALEQLRQGNGQRPRTTTPIR